MDIGQKVRIQQRNGDPKSPGPTGKIIGSGYIVLGQTLEEKVIVMLDPEYYFYNPAETVFVTQLSLAIDEVQKV